MSATGRPVGRYASDTSVPAERTAAEIGELLRRYGAGGFMYGWEDDAAMVRFRVGDYVIRFVLPLPNPADPVFARTDSGRLRTDPDTIRKAYEQAVRSRWRALLLTIKAKLEATEVGISTVLEEFLSWIELPDGSTVGPRVREQVDQAYSSGAVPPAILPPTAFEPRALESGR